MNIMIGDTILTHDREIGIVEGRAGNTLTVRFPDQGNHRRDLLRSEVKPLGDVIRRAREEGRPLQLGAGISLVGGSAVADLVALFGYSTGLMRRESLNKVRRQLERAGLEVTAETDWFSREDWFKIGVRPDGEEEVADDADDGSKQESTTTTVRIPDPFWPTALGLERVRESEFLRALTESNPILCLLYVPGSPQIQDWLQAAWEGVIGWAFRSAQRFVRNADRSGPEIEVRIGPAALLHGYLKPSVLDGDKLSLNDGPHALNLITIKRELEIPTEFARLSAVWPGPIFEFKPEYQGKPSADIESINQCLSLVAGVTPSDTTDRSPLVMLSWARTSYARLVTRPVIEWGSVLVSTSTPAFKGSNECSTTLALKTHLAAWVKRETKTEVLQFEYSDNGEDDDELDDERSESFSVRRRKRIDLRVPGLGDFEVESMRGSGPIEHFYHKILSRLEGDTPFSLIVPSDSVLWAGPYLADVAHHLGRRDGRVMIPSADGSFLQVAGLDLTPLSMEPIPADGIKESGRQPVIEPEVAIRLQDVVGYSEVRRRVDELIIWPEKHRTYLRPASRSSGVLFFGPPGCGKSRWARAIAGELEQEVRLLAPSDLRGAYVGWGQILIREQFDWLAENERRMLIIDELDAVARSRQESQMHSDEKACVNELLVQLDRVLRLGRLVVATTNFIGSMDDAVMRSGRFGRFIPVPPPDLAESIDIMSYYLERLAKSSDKEKKLRVCVPEKAGLSAIIKPLFDESSLRCQYYCGADLEEAVNRAFLRSVRAAVPDGGWSQDLGVVEVSVSEQELSKSLAEVPRSVQIDATDRFLDDINRFCDRDFADCLSQRLRPGKDA